MRQHGVASVVVTTPAGQLMGIVEGRTSNGALRLPCSLTRSEAAQRGTPASKLAISSLAKSIARVPWCAMPSRRRRPASRLPCSRIYHPWIAEQGQSPFVWSVIGSIAQATKRLRIGTGGRARSSGCTRLSSPKRPQLRPHCSQALYAWRGRREPQRHIFGDHWPPGATRRAMLEEAVASSAASGKGACGAITANTTRLRTPNCTPARAAP